MTPDLSVPALSSVGGLAGTGERTHRRRRRGPSDAEPVPTWATWHEAWRVLLFPGYRRAIIRIAMVVGTVLFLINQLDVVLAGKATGATWIKAAVTYVVPFGVACLGVLTGTRRRTA